MNSVPILCVVSVGEQTVATRMKVPWQRGGEKGRETQHFLFFLFSRFLVVKPVPPPMINQGSRGRNPMGTRLHMFDLYKLGVAVVCWVKALFSKTMEDVRPGVR